MASLKYFSDGDYIKTEELSTAVCKILKQKEKLYIELNFVSEEEIRTLNGEQRGIDKVTDVLSFPSLDGIRGKILKAKDHPFECDDEGLFLGSIVICIKRAAEQAEEYGHSLEREFTYLACHGTLHLFGYDHMTDEDKAEMRNLEEKIMDELKIYR